MSSGKLYAAAAMVDLPPDSMPTDAIVLVAYQDNEGTARVAMATLGDALITSRLGLLAWGQHAVVNDEPI